MFNVSYKFTITLLSMHFDNSFLSLRISFALSLTYFKQLCIISNSVKLQIINLIHEIFEYNYTQLKEIFQPFVGLKNLHSSQMFI